MTGWTEERVDAGRPDEGRGEAAHGFLVPVDVHFDELDSFGMLYNNRYGVLVERAWVNYWQRREIAFTKDWRALGDAFNVVKDFRITFETPIDSPGRYGVRIWVEHLGHSSLRYGFKICSADGTPPTYAHGARTLIRLDPETKRPTGWSEKARELVGEFTQPGD
ncbi:acyl-CoA thioesterase [Streptomyces sp. NPDC058653]|uniref:acyl-CoA thioesterase n=1 Tax=Streptomyces sp. NPDC058653 TaxID=3346576 RepID=UPI003665BB44